jgi:hypothetical protein
MSRQLIAQVECFSKELVCFSQMLVLARFTGGRETLDPPANSKAKQKTANYGIAKSNEKYNQNQKKD